MRIFRETHAISAMASSTTQDKREILHSAKDLGVGIATHMITHQFKTMLRTISAVFTHPQESQ